MNHMRWHLFLLITLLLGGLGPFQAVAQAPNSASVYPSPTGNLLYQLDSRGQHITDFFQCGYRGGTVPLPNGTALIPQSRWVYVSHSIINQAGFGASLRGFIGLVRPPVFSDYE
jgi:hypothetical protein